MRIGYNSGVGSSCDARSTATGCPPLKMRAISRCSSHLQRVIWCEKAPFFLGPVLSGPVRLAVILEELDSLDFKAGRATHLSDHVGEGLGCNTGVRHAICRQRQVCRGGSDRVEAKLAHGVLLSSKEPSSAAFTL